ncbi:hypothetical protein GCM10027430_02250 [Lysobacter tyrosinilyticus]
MAALIAAGLCCGTAQAAYSWANPVSFKVDDSTFGSAIGDVTGDGRNDLVITGASGTGSKVYVYAQKGDGTLNTSPQVYSLDVGTSALAMGDLNQDGIQDVVLGQNGFITTLVSNAAHPGSLTKQTLTTGVTSFRVGLAHMDLDGTLDVVSTNGAVMPLTRPMYFRGKGDGTLDPRPVILGRSFESGWTLKASDGEGLRENLLMTDSSGRAQLIRKDPGRAPTAPIKIDPGFVVEDALLADYTGDGHDDLVVVGTGGYYDTLLYVYDPRQSPDYAQAAASLQSWRFLSFNPLLGGDLNGDGRADLVVNHNGRVGLFLQGSNGLGSEQELPWTLTNATSLKAGDLNSDGCPDIATTSLSVWVTVFYGSGCVGPVPPKRPDLRMAVSTTLDAATVTLSTTFAQTPINAPLVEIALSVSTGSLELGELPANCVVRSQSPRTRKVDCLTASLGSNLTRTISLPIVVAADSTRRSQLVVSARALTDTPELSKSNNAASVTKGIAPAAGVGPTRAGAITAKKQARAQVLK